ncbi:MAG: thioesterase family protein [Caldicoprobacter sp.]|uniref:acyl-CoA thioesterase n=1 Tax=Caldicoprobacter sp. TaxID=2004500 RepID=UPI001D695C6F|nr:acyl-CoA thioesterase [Clostridia bacterium]
MIVVDTKIRVRYKETDKMGVVHHSNYYTWFEIGRSEYMRARGMTYRSMEEKGLMLPVIEARCFYKQPAKYDDVIVIRTHMADFKGVRLKMEYEVIREEDGVLLAKGYTVHAITDANLKPVNIKKVDSELYKFFMECIEG